jgi:hypothetical protein
MFKTIRNVSKPSFRNSIFATGAIVLLLSTTSCTYFSKTAQDKAACDKLSDLITTYSGSASSTSDALLYSLSAGQAFSSFGDQIESEVMPLASMDFAPSLDKLVKYLRKSNSASIFDQSASYLYGLDTIGEVTGHCILVSKED